MGKTEKSNSITKWLAASAAMIGLASLIASLISLSNIGYLFEKFLRYSETFSHFLEIVTLFIATLSITKLKSSFNRDDKSKNEKK